MKSSPRVLPLPYQSDSATWFACLADWPQPVWLDAGRPGSDYGRFDVLAAEPEAVLSHRAGQTCIENGMGHHRIDGDPFDLIAQWLPPTLESVDDLPFVSGAIGYFSYDLARQLERLPTTAQDDIALPDFWLGLYPWAIVQDHRERQAFLVSRPEFDPADLHRRLCGFDPHRKLKEILEKKGNSFKINGFRPELTENSYYKKLAQVKEYIEAGDCYQVNLAQRFRTEYQGDPLEAYLRLRQALPSPFSGYVPLPEGAVLSLSPERFIALRDGLVETRPIKGTLARHADRARDQAAADALQRSSKDRAENLMIVDLLRNDLSKCCDAVRVPALFELQSFANVHHLVSTVTGQLKPGATAVDLLRSSFPGGSITGAPKIRAMEIIEELEPVRRSVYCGSLGYLSADGQMDTSIAIRTLVCHKNQLYCWGGGGIVADSEPEAEYRESWDKVRVLMETLERAFGPRD